MVVVVVVVVDNENQRCRGHQVQPGAVTCDPVVMAIDSCLLLTTMCCICALDASLA